MVSLVVDKCGRLKLYIAMELPPTDNHIYFNLPRRDGRGGGRALTSKAKKYKTLVKEKTALAAITNKFSFRENIPYRVEITLYLNLFTKGWPKKAKWRFQKIDTLNRTKLLLDSIADAIGVDDRHMIDIVVRKEDDPSDPRVEVVVEELWDRY